MFTNMNEKIVSIKEIQGFEFSGKKSIWDNSFAGFEVLTDKHSYKVLISNDQSCCENWGYAISEDNPDSFIDSTLQEITLTDTKLRTFAPNELPEDTSYSEYYNGLIQFVSFTTSNGLFQLAVYNEHNGYYGHTIFVTKDDEVIFDSVL